MTPTHYGIIGLGPVGTLLATFLSAAGQRVSALCLDPAHADALSSQPLKAFGAISAESRIHRAYTDLAEFLAAGPEVVLIVTKSSDSPPLLDRILAAKPDPRVVFLSCQNGIDVEAQISERFGAERALRMVMNVGCRLKAPTQVEVVFSLPNILSDVPAVRAELRQKIADDFNSAGFPVKRVEGYQTEVFKKAILNSSMGALSALTGKTMQDVLGDAGLRAVLRTMIQEDIEIAQRLGLPIGEAFIEEALAYMARGGNHRPSMLEDMERGRITENDNHCGRLVFYADKLGVPAPMNHAMNALMRNRERREGRA